MLAYLLFFESAKITNAVLLKKLVIVFFGKFFFPRVRFLMFLPEKFVIFSDDINIFFVFRSLKKSY